MGHDTVSRALQQVGELGRRLLEELAERKPWHRRYDPRRLDHVVAGVNGDRAIRCTPELGRNARAHGAAVPLDELAGRLGIHEVQRLGPADTMAAASARPPNISPAHERRRVPLRQPAIGPGCQRQGIHSICRRGVCPLRISQFSTVSPGDAAIPG